MPVSFHAVAASTVVYFSRRPDGRPPGRSSVVARGAELDAVDVAAIEAARRSARLGELDRAAADADQVSLDAAARPKDERVGHGRGGDDPGRGNQQEGAYGHGTPPIAHGGGSTGPVKRRASSGDNGRSDDNAAGPDRLRAAAFGRGVGMRRQWWVLSAVLCLVAAAAVCTRAKKPRERGELTESEKAVVAAFTSGTISRESPIRVAFHEAVARARAGRRAARRLALPLRAADRGHGGVGRPRPHRVPPGGAAARRPDLRGEPRPHPPAARREDAARALRLRLLHHASVLRRRGGRAAGRRRDRRQAPGAHRPAGDRRRRGGPRGREGAAGVLRRAATCPSPGPTRRTVASTPSRWAGSSARRRPPPSA